jgi:hypothetical protein
MVLKPVVLPSLKIVNGQDKMLVDLFNNEVIKTESSSFEIFGNFVLNDIDSTEYLDKYKFTLKYKAN